MPKKVKKKVSKKEKTSNKQNVNVKIKIDQSRRTNPRQTNSKTNLPSRFYPSNSSTPLHTTITTATPSPVVLQKEPSYAEAVNTLFQDAIMKTNRQLNQLTDVVAQKDEQINQLVQQTQLPPTKHLYKLLMSEHMARTGGMEAPEEVKDFKDPNAKVSSPLKPAGNPPGADEASEEPSVPVKIKQATPVSKRTRQATKNTSQTVPVEQPKRRRGRPSKIQLQLEENDGVPDLR